MCNVLFKTSKNIKKIFIQICKEYSWMHPDFYYLITYNETLQKFINIKVIEEFFNNDTNVELYYNEIKWKTSGISNNKYLDDYKNIIHDTLSQKYNVEYVTNLHRFDCDIVKLVER